MVACDKNLRILEPREGSLPQVWGQFELTEILAGHIFNSEGEEDDEEENKEKEVKEAKKSEDVIKYHF